MDINEQVERAIFENSPEFIPLSIYEATMLTDASVWACNRRVKAETRRPGQITRLKRIKTALERDVVDQLRRLNGVTIYEQDNQGRRFNVELGDGLIRDELVGVIHGLPGQERDHLAIVIDIVSIEVYADAKNAEFTGDKDHFKKWETMAGMFAKGANVVGSVLILLCARTAQWMVINTDRDDKEIDDRINEITEFIKVGQTPENVRKAIGHNAIAITCRTCTHFNTDGPTAWKCGKIIKQGGDGILTDIVQNRANECHLIHPDLMPLEFLDQPTDGAAWYKATNGDIIEVLAETEGHSDASLVDRCITSREAAALSGSSEFFIDPLIDELKGKLSAKLV